MLRSVTISCRGDSALKGLLAFSLFVGCGHRDAEELDVTIEPTSVSTSPYLMSELDRTVSEECRFYISNNSHSECVVLVTSKGCSCIDLRAYDAQQAGDERRGWRIPPQCKQQLGMTVRVPHKPGRNRSTVYFLASFPDYGKRQLLKFTVECPVAQDISSFPPVIDIQKTDNLTLTLSRKIRSVSSPDWRELRVGGVPNGVDVSIVDHEPAVLWKPGVWEKRARLTLDVNDVPVSHLAGMVLHVSDAETECRIPFQVESQDNQDPEGIKCTKLVHFGVVPTGHARTRVALLQDDERSFGIAECQVVGSGYTILESDSRLTMSHRHQVRVEFSSSSPGRHTGQLTIRTHDGRWLETIELDASVANF